MKLHRFIGALFILTFVVLMAFRVGAFRDPSPELDGGLPDEIRSQGEQETWMGVFLQGQPIGYVHRQRSGTSTGHRIVESVFLRLNTMGMVEDVRFKTEGVLLPDFTLSSFAFDLQSSLFRFRALGIRNGDTLTLFTGTSDLDRRTRIRLEKDLFLSVDLFRPLTEAGIQPGDHRTLLLFDPATASQRAVKITLVGPDVISVMGQRKKVLKWSVDSAGVPQYAWTGEDEYTVKLQYTGTPFCRTLTLRYAGDTVQVKQRDNVSFGPLEKGEIKGRVAR